MNIIKSEILDSYYLQIETIDEFIPHSIFPSMEDVTEYELKYLRIEYWTGTILNEKDTIDRFYQEKDEVIEYLKLRIESTLNDILKAKYCNFIFILTKNNSFAQKAIDLYQRALTSAFQNTDREHYELRVDEFLEIILELSIRIKYKIVELKKQIIGYLSDNTISDRLKTRMFMSVKDSNLFTVKDSVSFPSTFINIAKSTTEICWIEHNLNLALFFAQKQPDQQLMQTIYELLGDNEYKKILPDDEKNLAVPHINEGIYEKVICYYQKAKCTEKLKQVSKLHEANKPKKQYIPIQVKTEISEEFVDSLNKYLDYISSMPSLAIVANLILGKLFLFIPNDKLNEIIQNRKTSLHEELFVPVQVDINENHKKSSPNDNTKFQYYDIMMRRNNIPFVVHSIARFVKERKLSYKKLYNILNKHTVFGMEMTKNKNNSSINYTWLSMVDIGFENFFMQFQRLLKGKSTDWRVCIDVLSVKFEGILRDMLSLNGAVITKFKDGNTSLITLEQMIRLESESIKDAFYNSFDDDDLNLFQYVFSSIAQCRNIRNNVAHCYYLPQMYTIEIAVLLFICILRLAKFVPKNDTNSE